MPTFIFLIFCGVAGGLGLPCREAVVEAVPVSSSVLL